MSENNKQLFEKVRKLIKKTAVATAVIGITTAAPALLTHSIEQKKHMKEEQKELFSQKCQAQKHTIINFNCGGLPPYKCVEDVLKEKDACLLKTSYKGWYDIVDKNNKIVGSMSTVQDKEGHSKVRSVKIIETSDLVPLLHERLPFGTSKSALSLLENESVVQALQRDKKLFYLRQKLGPLPCESISRSASPRV